MIIPVSAFVIFTLVAGIGFIVNHLDDAKESKNQKKQQEKIQEAKK